jgi:hypothetical protein
MSEKPKSKEKKSTSVKKEGDKKSVSSKKADGDKSSTKSRKIKKPIEDDREHSQFSDHPKGGLVSS